MNDLSSLVPLPFAAGHAHTPGVLVTAWAVIAGQTIVFSLVAWWNLRK